MSKWNLFLASVLLLSACGTDTDRDPATEDPSTVAGVDDPDSFAKSIVPVNPDVQDGDASATLEGQDVGTTGAVAFQDALAPAGQNPLAVADPMSQEKAIAEISAYNPANLRYHGGPILKYPLTVYFIWYGNWTNNSAMTMLPMLINQLNGSRHWRINSTYTNAYAEPVTSSVRYGGGIFNNYSYGKRLRDPYVRQLIQDAIDQGKFPRDRFATFFVVGSADVSEQSGFCTRYCGWHTSVYMNNVSIKIGFLGDSSQCPARCQAQTKSLNGNPGAEGMAMHLVALLNKIGTDPDENAWYVDGVTGDYHRVENADLCAGTFGATSQTPSGARYNATVGSYKLLLQRNWLRTPNGGRCALAY